MRRDVLCRPFPPEQVRQRQGQGGKVLSYVETHAVIARLNEGCDTWDFTVEKYEVLEDDVVVLGKLVIEGAMTKFAFGGSSITRDHEGRVVSMADDLKSAASDALKKSASLVGIGLELYGGGAAEAAAPRSPRAPSPESPNDRLTSRQLSAIQSITRRRNIARGHLTSMLEERFKKADLGHLSRREASSFISELAEANGVAR